MADSVVKDLIDVLNAGTWTTEPAYVQVVLSTQDTLNQAFDSGSTGTLLFFPHNVSDSYANGIAVEEWEIPVTFVYTAAHTDANQQLCEDVLSDLKDVLAAGTLPSGVIGMFRSDWTNGTFKDNDKYWYYETSITVIKTGLTTALAGNQLWLRNLIDTEWDISVIAKPTFAPMIQKRIGYATGNYIFISPPDYVSETTDINSKFRNEDETFTVLLTASSETNLSKMKLALIRVINEDFYPSGSYMNLDDETVALWHLNEGTGTDADDAGPTDYDLTLTADTLWSGEGYNSADGLTIDADNEAASNADMFKDGSNLVPPNGTFECFFKVNVAGDIILFSHAGGALQYISCGYSTALGAIGIYIANASVYSATITLPGFQVSKWYKFMATWGARGMEFFLDNLLMATATYTGNWDEGATLTAGIGDKVAGANTVDYDIDEPRVSNVQRGPYDKLEIQSAGSSHGVHESVFIIVGKRDGVMG